MALVLSILSTRKYVSMYSKHKLWRRTRKYTIYRAFRLSTLSIIYMLTAFCPIGHFLINCRPWFEFTARSLALGKARGQFLLLIKELFFLMVSRPNWLYCGSSPNWSVKLKRMRRWINEFVVNCFLTQNQEFSREIGIRWPSGENAKEYNHSGSVWHSFLFRKPSALAGVPKFKEKRKHLVFYCWDDGFGESTHKSNTPAQGLEYLRRSQRVRCARSRYSNLL